MVRGHESEERVRLAIRVILGLWRKGILQCSIQAVGKGVVNHLDL